MIEMPLRAKYTERKATKTTARKQKTGGAKRQVRVRNRPSPPGGRI